MFDPKLGNNLIEDNRKLKKHIEYLEQNIYEFNKIIQDYQLKIQLNEKEIKDRNHEYDSLTFRNNQLCKRVELLQKELTMLQRYPTKNNQLKNNMTNNNNTEILKQELCERLLVNEKLHKDIKDIEDTYLEKIERLEIELHKITSQNILSNNCMAEGPFNTLTSKPTMFSNNISNKEYLSIPSPSDKPSSKSTTNNNTHLIKFINLFNQLTHFLLILKYLISKQEDINKFELDTSMAAICPTNHLSLDESFLKLNIRIIKLVASTDHSSKLLLALNQVKESDNQVSDSVCDMVSIFQDLSKRLKITTLDDQSGGLATGREENAGLLIDLSDNSAIHTAPVTNSRESQPPSKSAFTVLDAYSDQFARLSGRVESVMDEDSDKSDIFGSVFQIISDGFRELSSRVNELTGIEGVGDKGFPRGDVSRILNLDHGGNYDGAKSCPEENLDSFASLVVKCIIACTRQINAAIERLSCPQTDSSVAKSTSPDVDCDKEGDLQRWDIYASCVERLISQVYAAYLSNHSQQPETDPSNLISTPQMTALEEASKASDLKTAGMRETILESGSLSRAYLDEMLAMSNRMALLMNDLRDRDSICGDYRSEIRRLNEELSTTRLNYEDQLSAMSDHVCLLNEQLSIFKEEMILNATANGHRVPFDH